jgi:hypothetical protein
MQHVGMDGVQIGWGASRSGNCIGHVMCPLLSYKGEGHGAAKRAPSGMLDRS